MSGTERYRHGSSTVAAFAGAAAVALAALAPGPALAKNQPVLCESQNYGYKHCSMKTAYGIVLVTQISRGRGECIQGQSWGWDSAGVWVTQGCRASFIQGNWANDFPSVSGGGRAGSAASSSVGGSGSGGSGGEDFSLDSLFSALAGGGAQSASSLGGSSLGGSSLGGSSGAGSGFGGGRCYKPTDAVTCESRNYGYTHCPMKAAYGVKIVAQMSSGRGECVEGRTWGWDSGGVWVDGGCRGRFIQGNWDACGPTPGVRQAAAAPTAAPGIPVTGMPWQQGGTAGSGGWRPPEQHGATVSQRDLAGCRDSLNSYVHQQASHSRRVAIDVERTDARLQEGNTVVEETARVSTDFGDGRVAYRCTIAPSGQIIAFDARDL